MLPGCCKRFVASATHCERNEHRPFSREPNGRALMSLRTRLLLRVAAVMGIGLTLLGVLVHLLLQAALTREVDELLRSRAAAVADELRSGALGTPARIGDRPGGITEGAD